MEYLQAFTNHLEANGASKITIKNYLADVRKFIRFIEETYSRPFQLADFTADTIKAYKASLQSSQTSISSQERYLSSLRKFATFLHGEHKLPFNPFTAIAESKPVTDIWALSPFKQDLLLNKASDLTIKNYVLDIKQFASWLESVDQNISKTTPFSSVTTDVIEEYKNRLVDEMDLSPLSVNRKLSSIRRYVSFLLKSERLNTQPLILNTDNQQNQKVSEEDKESSSKKLGFEKTEEKVSDTWIPDHVWDDKGEKAPAHPTELERNGDTLETSDTSHQYSSFAPVRLSQKIQKLFRIIFDTILILPIIALLEKASLIVRKSHGAKGLFEDAVATGATQSGRSLLSTLTGIKKFTQTSGTPSALNEFIVSDPRKLFKGKISNLSKAFYAPLSISTENLPRHKKILHHLRYTRPDWYKKYHSYAIAHYLNFAIMMIFITVIGASMYSVFFDGGKKSPTLAAYTPNVAPPRILSFQGRLTDSSDNPITTYKNVRFAIYEDVSASGSGHLLWQELQGVTPDADGVFSVLMGNTGSTCASPLTVATGACAIPSTLFTQNATLYLGITIENDTELSPRQQVASVAYATNSETLQGLAPISGSNTTNVVLALDSAGNLTIGGSATPTFQASGGQFTLSGTVLNLTTTTGSNSNIQLNPDGSGKNDFQKAIINSTLNGPLPTAAGAVQVDDLFAINATSSGQSAFTLNQDSTGPLISASTSGVAKFTVGNDGTGYFAGNLGVGTTVAVGAKLQVNGTVLATSYGLGAGFNSVLANSGSEIQLGNSGSFSSTSIFSGSTRALTATGGNIGIGTTVAGSFKLEVAGNVGPSADATYDLGSATKRWNNIYAANIIGGSSGVQGFWQLNNGALSPYYPANDLLLGSTATSSAKIAFINIAGGNPTATFSGNFSVSSPTGSAPTVTQNVLNGGTLNFQTSAGGDAGLSSRLFITNNGNVGIGSTSPGGKLDVVSTGTTTNGLNLTANSLTTGYGAYFSSTSTGLTTGSLLGLDWSPGSATTATGDLLSLNIGANGTLGNILNVKDNGSSVFSVSQTAVTSNVPVNFTSPGDVSMAYDLNFTNPTASYINSSAPLYLRAGEVFNSSDLTLSTYNKGNVIVDSEAFVTTQSATISGKLVVGTSTAPANIGNFYLTNSGTFGKALAILNQTETADLFTASASGTTKFVINSAGNVGIGTSLPAQLFDVQGGSGIVGQFSGRVIGANAVNSNEFATLGQIAGGAGQYWQLNSGALSPSNATFDVLVGSNATASALIKLGGTTNATSFFNTGGNVGIGTTGSVEKLQVAGNIRLPSVDNYIAFGSSAMRIQASNSGGNLDFAGGTQTNAFRFWSNNMASVLAVINDNGNVGIGTSTVNSKLEVKGSTTGNALVTFNNTTSNGDLLTASASGTTRFVISNAGNVGIGSSLPAAKLDVNGTANIGGAFAVNNGAASTFSGAVSLGNGNDNVDVNSTDLFVNGTSGNVGIGTSTVNSLLHARGTTTGNSLVTFDQLTSGADILTGSASGTTKFVFNSNGNLGIGTSNPTVALHVIGSGIFSSTVYAPNLSNGTTANNANIALNTTGTVITRNIADSNPVLAVKNSHASSTGDILQLQDNSSTLGVFTQTGNLGIGSTTPAYKLDVSGGSGIVGQFSGRVIGADAVNSNEFATLGQIAGGAGQYWQLNSNALAPSNTTFDVLVGSTATGSALVKLPGNTNRDAFFNLGTGNVGINTTAPIAKLQVNSDANFSYPTMGTGVGAFHIIPTSGTNDNTSAITFGYNTSGSVGTAAEAGIYVQSSSAYGTKMYFGTTNSYATGSQARMMIDQNGNIGIGTTSPSQLLAVGSSSQFQVNTTGQAKAATLALGTGTLALTDRLFDINSSQAYGSSALYTGSIQNTRTGTLTANVTDYNQYNVLTLNGTDGQFVHTSYGLYNNVTLSNGNTTDSMYGIRSQVVNNSSTLSDIGTTATSSAGLYIDTYNNAASGVITNNSGGIISAFNNSTGTITTNYGLNVDAYNQNGTMTTNFGGSFAARQLGTGSMSTAYGVYSQAYINNASGSLTTAYGARTLAFTNVANSAITTAYGLYSSVATASATTTGGITNGYAGYFAISNPMNNGAYGIYSTVTGVGTGTNYGALLNTTGSVTNNTGLRITGTVAGASNYAIYADAAAQSYFNGNVGIGTTASAAKLNVSSSGTAGIVEGLRLGYNNAVSSGSKIGFWAGNTTTETARIEHNLDTGTTASLRFYTYNSGLSERLRIAADGNVGIGSTSPTAKLDVVGGGLFSTAVGIGTTSAGDQLHVAANGGVGIRLDDLTPTTGGDSRITQVGQKLSFNTYSNGHVFTGTPLVLDGATQFVGIGSTTPAYKLDVSGGSGIVAQFSGRVIGADAVNSNEFATLGQIASGAGQYWQLNSGALAPTNITNDVLVGASATSSAIVKLPGLTNNNAYFNLGTGNLGVGTTTPSNAKLDVIGNVNISSGGQGIIIGADNNVTTRTDATAKISRIMSPHYSNAASNVTLLFGNMSSGSNDIYLGGGTGVGNAATGLHFYTAANSTTATGTERMTIDLNGNLGVGTTSTTSKLQVNGSAAIGYSTSTAAPANGLAVSGNVGIGTTTASDVLTVNGNLRFVNGTANRIFYGTAGVAAPGAGSNGAKIQLYGAAGTVGVSDYSLGVESTYLWQNSDGGFKWYTDSAETMRLDLNGNLGIGTTTTSTAKLNVAGTGYFSGNVAIGTTTTTNAALNVVGNTHIQGTTKEFFSGEETRTYRNLAQYHIDSPTQTGTVKIALPAAKHNPTTMMVIKITGYNYVDNGGAWEAIISGYNYSGGAWINTSAEIRGSAPFTSIRLGDDSTSDVILLGDTSTVWQYPQIFINEVQVGYTNEDGWEGPWTISMITDETGITIDKTPLIKMYAATNGNIGIGSTAPTAKLDVAGDASTSGSLVFNGSNKSVDVLNGSSLSFATSPGGDAGLATKLTLLNNGNFGIGTTTPGEKLHISGGQLLVDYTGSNAFRIRDNSFNTIFKVDSSSSRVGIGTTTPGYTFDVQGGSGIVGQFSGRVIGADAVNSNEFATLGQIAGGAGQYWQLNSGALAPSNITNDVLVGGSATASAKVRLGGTTNADSFFNTGGNVGIGTTAANARLEIAGSTWANATGGDLRVTSSATVGTAVTLNASGTSGSIFSLLSTGSGASAGAGKLVFYDNTNAAYRMTIDSAGNVGIGTTTANYKLEVNGTIGLTDGSGTSYGSSISHSSSSPYRFLTLTSNGGTGAWRGGINFDTNYNAGSTFTAMTIRANTDGTTANVGIGTTAAGSTLQVNGGTALGYSTSTAAPANGLTVAGNVGIGTTTATETLEIVGDIKQTNTRTRTMTRTIPTTVNDEVDIGSFAFTNGGGSLWVSITVPSSSFSVAKEYLIPVKYSQTTGTWTIALPTSSTGSYSSNDFDLDVNVSSGTTSLRIRRTLGSTAGTAYIVIRQDGINTDAFTASTATSSVAAPTTYFGSTALTQINGNVGIGTTAPAYSIDTTGDLNVGGKDILLGGANRFNDSTSASYTDIRPQNNWLILYNAANDQRFGIFDSTGNKYLDMYQTSTYGQINAQGSSLALQTGAGNVGIGTTAPLGKFNVVGNTTTAQGQALAIFAQSGTADILTASTGATTRFVINNAGNVGIGSTVPAYLLDVSGGAGIVGQFSGRVIGADAVNSNEFATLGQIAGGAGQYWQLNSGALAPTNITNDVLVGGSATASALIRFGGTTNANSFFNTGGNVGIGTSAPAVAFDVLGTQSRFRNATNPLLEIYETGSGGNRRLALQVDTTNSLSVINSTFGSVGAYPLSFQIGGSDKLRIDANGNVGIGTTATTSKLQVNGSTAIGYSTSTTAPTNGLAVSGNVGIGTTTATNPLTVAGATTTNIIAVTPGTGTATDAGYVSVNSRARFGYDGTGILIDDGNTTKGFKITLGSTDRFYIHPTSGNTGIGTTSGLNDLLTVNGSTNLTTGNAYKIAGTSVLNATTLGSGVLTSSLTTVGALNAGSITSGFGNINNGTSGITTNVFTSTQATGTAPLTVASTTKVTNLNADYLDGIDSTGFCQSDGTGCSLAQFWQLNSGALAPTNITNDVLVGGSATASAKIRLGGTTNANSYFNTGGNLGIGTTIPVAVLHSSISNSAAPVALFERTTASTGSFGINFNSGLSNLESVNAIRFTTGATAGTGGTERMRIDTTGNVGIGSTTPGSLFDLSGGVGRQNGYTFAAAGEDSLIVNGDFEQGSYGWTASTPANATVVTGGYSGNNALQVTGATNINSNDYIPVDPVNDVIQLEAYLKKSTAGTTPGLLYFGYYAYNASKTLITTAPCGSYCYFAASGTVLAADGNWHKYTATTTGEGTSYPNFPVGTKYIRVLGLINYSASSDSVTQIDHISLRRINNGPLFVGNNFSSTNLVDQTQVTKLYTTATNQFIITPPSSGNVGIGTTTTPATLSVSGTGYYSGNVGIGTTTLSGARLSVVGGNVGIGTSTASNLLTVNQAADTTAVTSASYGIALINQGTTNLTLGSDATYNYLQSWASKPLYLNSQGNNIYTGAGNVGIGTTTTRAKLDIAGTASLSGNLVFNSASTQYIDSLQGSSLNFRTSPGGDAGLTTKLAILSNGNIGIGTATPTRALHVVGDILGTQTAYLANGQQTYYAETYSVPTATNTNINLTAGNNTLSSGMQYRVVLSTTGTSTNTGAVYIVYQTAVGTWTSRMVSANGTTSNHPLLGVSGTNVYVYHNHASTYSIRAQVYGLDSGNATNTATTYFGLEGEMTNLAGNIGVGTTAPIAKLDVTGNARIGTGTLSSGAPTTNLAISSSTDNSNVGLFLNIPEGTNNYRSWMKLDDTTGITTFDATYTTGSAPTFAFGKSVAFPGSGIWNGSGNIGIGSTSPAYKLDVSGGSGIVGQFSGRVIGGDAVNSNEFVTLSQLTGGTGQYWQLNSGALAPFSSTADILIGSSATTSAKFGFINIAAGTPTATISGNLSLAVPTGSNPAATLNVLNGGSLNFQTALTGQGDGGLTSRLFIKNDGNIGIGTTGPTTLMEISSTKNPVSNLDTIANYNLYLHSAQDGSNNGTGIAFGGSSGPVMGASIAFVRQGSNSYGDLLFATKPSGGVTTERLRIDSNGNVGIGTTSPFGKLNVVGTSANPIGKAALAIIQNETNGDLFTASAGATTRFVINNAGNVGIGTSIPSSDIHIYGRAADAQTVLKVEHNSGSAGQGVLSLTSAGSGGRTYTITSADVSYANGSGLLFEQADGLSVKFMNTGNVGIGTTAPTAKLDVAGDASTSGSLVFNGSNKSIDVLNGSSLSVATSVGGDAGLASRLYVANNGNIGVGTTNPLHTTEVIGTTLVGGNVGIEISGQTIRGGTSASGVAVDHNLIINANSLAGTLALQANSTTQVYLDGSSGNLGLAGVTNPSSFPVQSGGSIGPNTNNAYDLGSTSLQWRNIYASGSICFAGGTDCTTSFSTLGVNYWNQTAGTIQPKNATVDLLIGGTATTSAKFGFINVNSGTPTATISGNLAIATPTGSAPANTYSVLNGGTINFQTSVGGDAGLTSRLKILNNGNIGIGSSTPTQALDIVGNITANGTTGLTLTGTGSGITFATGTGNHDITASAGTLRLGAATLTGTITGGNQNITGTGNISATSGSNTITGYGTIGTSGTTAFTGSTLALTGAATGATSYNGLVITANTGTITTGTWNGTAIGAQYGGTGLNTSASTGVPSISSGTWSVAATLATSLGGLGANVTAAGAGELLYSSGTTTYGHLAAGTSGQVLLSGGAGAPSWSNTNTSAFGLWDLLTGGVLTPKNATTDLLLGGTSSASARIAFLNIAGGNPTASLSGNLAISSPTGSAPATGFLALNGGSLNFKTSVGGDAGATTRFSIANNGTLTASTFTANGGLLYTNGSGVFAQTTVGSNGQCLQSIGGGTPTWGSCGGLNYWTSTNGALYPTNATMDLLIGGTASSAAKFTFTNVNSGTPTFKAFNSSSTQYVSINHDGTNANITASTGTINIGAGGGTLYVNTDIKNDSTNYSGFVKVADKLLVQGATEDSHNALAIFDNTLPGDILTASSSGTPRFVISGAGNVGIGTTLPGNLLTITSTSSFSQAIGLDTNTSTKQASIGFSSAGSQRWQLGKNTDDSFYLYDAGNARTDFSIASSGDMQLMANGGNVGVGTTTPLGLFNVNGSTTTAQGQPLVLLNQTGSSDILTASTSGNRKMYIDNGGQVYAPTFLDFNTPGFFLDPAAPYASASLSAEVKTQYGGFTVGDGNQTLNSVNQLLYTQGAGQGNILAAAGFISGPFGGLGRSENYLTQSQGLDNVGGAPWTKDTNLTISATNIVAPDGTPTAEQLTGGTAPATIYQSYTTSAANSIWTFSIWLKRGSATGKAYIRLSDVNGSNTVLHTESTQIDFSRDDTAGWVRYDVALKTQASAVASVRAIIDMGGLSSATMYAWGAQLENAGVDTGSTPPSPRPGVYTATTTVAATTSNKGGTINGNFMVPTGNVGVGTTTGTNKLDVSGGIAIGTYAGVTAAPSNGLIVSGNTGIGTTTGTNKFDVLGGAAFGTYGGVSAAPTNGLIVSGNTGIGTTTGTNKLDVLGGVAIGTYAGVNTAPSNGLAVSGNVGIGTTTIGARLHIVGVANSSSTPASWAQNVILDTTSGTNNVTEFRVAGTKKGSIRIDSSGNAIFQGASTGGTYLAWDEGSGGVHFGNGSATEIGSISSAGALVMNGTGTFGTNARISGSSVSYFNGGNLGIGTTTANAKLSIGNNVATGFLDTYSEYQEILYDGATAASSYGLGVKGSTMVFNSGGGAYSFDSAGTSTAMTIDTAGNVGIGTTTVNSKLYVTGTVASGISYVRTGAADGRITVGDNTKSWSWSSGWSTAGNLSLIEEGVAGDIMAIKQGGNIGFGTTTLHRKFVAQGSTNGGTPVGFINADTTDNSGSGVIALGTGAAASTSNVRFIKFFAGSTDDNFAGTAVGNVRLNGSSTVTYATSGADYGEWVDMGEQAELGDIIAYTGNKGVRATKGTSFIGVRSDKSGFLGNEQYATSQANQQIVGLIGQIATKVALTNGPIKKGDVITISNIPGVGEKATSAGQIIGKALEDFDGTANTITCPQSTGATCGKIMLYVNPSWYDPDVYITDSGNLNIAGSNGTYTASNAGSISSRIGIFASAAIAQLKAGMITVSELTASALNVTGTLTTQSLAIASSNITIAGQSINDFIDARVNALINNRIADGSLTSPLASTSATVTAGRIIIKSPVATSLPVLDVTGNASISGNLTADTATISGSLSANDLSANSATISGTLHATNIIADNITSLSAQIATLSATTIVNNFTTTIATMSGETASSSADFLASLYSNGIQTNFMNVASLSATSGFVPTLNSDFVTVNQGLIALGPTSLADTSIAGTLSVNGNLILSDSSINVLGADLQIQPLKQGGVSFEGGQIAFDTDGNMRVSGDANFGKNINVAGSVNTSYISALPGNDLNVNLPEGSTLAVNNASGSAVFKLNQIGDVIASGSGTFKELLANGLNIVRGAQADDSITETTASGSAGTAIINAYQTERTINTPYVTAKSLIYITPTSDTQGVTPYVSRQTAEDPDGLLGNGPTHGSFTIEIPHNISGDIKLNWWIVN